MNPRLLKQAIVYVNALETLSLTSLQGKDITKAKENAEIEQAFLYAVAEIAGLSRADAKKAIDLCVAEKVAGYKGLVK